MSTRARRRRPLPTPGTVKEAFGDEDTHQQHNNDNNNRELLLDEHESPNQSLDKSGAGELNRFYEAAFFTINDVTVEVKLENDTLSWSTLNNDAGVRVKSANPGGVSNSIDLHKVYAISPLYTRWNWSLNVNETVAGMTVSSSTNNGNSSSLTLNQKPTMRGFQLHAYDKVQESVLQEILVIFQSNQPNQIEQWYQFLSKIILEYKPPQTVLVICNPYSGPRDSRHNYNTKIKPMLEMAQYNVHYTEISDMCSAEEALAKFEDDLDLLYGLVIIGGDGSVINVLNAVLRYLANENRTRLDIENDLPSLPFGICIIPNGTTNIISHSIHGTTDHVTPLIHLLYNHRMKIDMSAVFNAENELVTANFGAGAGFPAHTLKYMRRYLFLSAKKALQQSFSKASMNKNLKPIEMEIRYIPAEPSNSSGSRCYRGCPTCTPPETEEMDNQVKAFDDSHIKKALKRNTSSSSLNGGNNRPLSANGKKMRSKNAPSRLSSMQQEPNWTVIHSQYLQVLVLTNAHLWSFAPQGLSKYGHLSDGQLDLILIHETPRKEFLRYVRRNGNSKNQFELPFTTLIKVKEVEIELKLPNNLNNESYLTDNPADSTPPEGSSSEELSDDENKQPVIAKHQPRPPSAPAPEDRRRHRRHRFSAQTQESSSHVLQSSKSVDSPVLHFKARSQQQQESEAESSLGDPYGSVISLSDQPRHRRGNIFQSLRSKKDKVPLPRPSSGRGGEPDDQQQKKNRRSSGTLRPARSLLNLLRGNSASSKQAKSSSNVEQNTLRESFSAGGSSRKQSVLSRSSSINSGKAPLSVTDLFRNKKTPCMWNLDFNPYNSPLIRIKCFQRFLPVFAVGLDPDTKLKEVNHSCFGRMG